MQGAVLSEQEEPAAPRRAGRGGFSLREAPPLYPRRRVLVLNRNWQAVSVIGVRRAFTLLFRDHARFIGLTGGEHALFDVGAWIDYSLRNPPGAHDAIQTVRMPLRIPDVMILSDYDRLPVKEARLSRESIFERDAHTCQYCGKTFTSSELTIDHVIPRERGGRNTWENLVTACKTCNSRKANRLPHEAGMALQHKPRRPPRMPFTATAIYEHGMSDQWRAFLPASGKTDIGSTAEAAS